MHPIDEPANWPEEEFMNDERMYINHIKEYVNSDIQKKKCFQLSANSTSIESVENQNL